MSDILNVRPDAPADPRQDMLLLWRRVLRTPQLGPDDDFFDLGGDSLLAIQLFAEIERATGRQLPITTIYDAPTPSLLVTLLDDLARPKQNSPLVLLNEGAAFPPAFLVHGVGGHVMELMRLGKCIDPARRVYGIQARGLDGSEPPLDNIDDMAEFYLDAMRRVQPHGPYILVGYSFGGLVALQMARRIEAEGERVALLAFIDSYPSATQWPLPTWLDVRLRRILHRAGTLARGWLARARRGGDDEVLPRKLFHPTAQRPFPVGEAWPDAVQKAYDAAVLALSRFHISPYAGQVIFFRAALRSFYLPEDPCSVWAGFLPITVVTVPGDHVDMIGSGAETLGRHLAARIADGLRPRVPVVR